jgi:hypothetical protein
MASEYKELAGDPGFVSVEDLIPVCPTCGPQAIESHPYYQVVRCSNCKEWLGEYGLGKRG